MRRTIMHVDPPQPAPQSDTADNPIPSGAAHIRTPLKQDPHTRTSFALERTPPTASAKRPRRAPANEPTGATAQSPTQTNTHIPAAPLEESKSCLSVRASVHAYVRT